MADVAERAGRKLPKHLHAEVQTILEAEALADHPKLSHQLNWKRIKTADRKIRQFLNKQDPKAERRAEVLDRLAGIVFILFTASLGVFFLALWQGYIP
ncbi:MAG: hypothetical protein AAFY31_01960 [Pseudomonadota bacterium]